LQGEKTGLTLPDNGETALWVAIRRNDAILMTVTKQSSRPLVPGPLLN
jgi:hypothetical protein